MTTQSAIDIILGSDLSRQEVCAVVAAEDKAAVNKLNAAFKRMIDNVGVDFTVADVRGYYVVDQDLRTLRGPIPKSYGEFAVAALQLTRLITSNPQFSDSLDEAEILMKIEGLEPSCVTEALWWFQGRI